MQNLPSPEEAALLLSKKGLKRLAKQRQPDWQKALDDLRYEQELEALQVELVKLQCWVQETGRRLAILFEGRDAAGKGGAIARFVQHLPPRAIRVVALPKPTDLEKGQWYFQRYTPHLPNPGEMVFFDRSWYNRAVVEPANGFCSEEQYRQFMRQVNDYEHLLYEDGLLLVKFWFDVSKGEQRKRMKQRRTDPLKQWKVSPVDQRAQELWDVYTEFQQRMFQGSHTSYSPWVLVQADSKRRARLECIRYVLAQFDYPGKSQAGTSLVPDPQVVSRYFRS